jgi:hypothetical protein
MLCLLLCVTTVVFWPLSNTRGRDGIGLAVGIRRAPAFSYRPGFDVMWGICENNSRCEVWYYTGSLPFIGALDAIAGNEGIGLSGARVIAYAPNLNDWYFGLALPFWLLGPLSFVGLLRTRHHKPPASGHCARCGYDLRATPDRCPECGRIPSKANA